LGEDDVVLGSSALLVERRTAIDAARFYSRLPQTLLCVGELLGGAALLLAFAFDRSSREYLWFAAFLWLDGSASLMDCFDHVYPIIGAGWQDWGNDFGLIARYAPLIGFLVVSPKALHSLIALGSIAIEERRRPGRKLMFWMGPGWLFNPTTADAAFDYVTELSTRLREARINLWSATEWPFFDSSGRPLPVTDLIYKDAIERLTPKRVTFSSLALHAIAMQTGGDMLETQNDLADLLSKHVGEASAFYSLTFDPPRTNQVDEYRALKLELGNPDLTAHTSAGYFDEPVFYDQSPAGVERVTVEQLEHALRRLDGGSDAEIAQQLSRMQLSERLNTARLATLQATLRGKKAREALVALADESTFLAPPSGEIPSTAPPDLATQRLIMLRTIDYVQKTISKLPDLFASRTMVQYHESPPKPLQTWKTAAVDQSLHLDKTSYAFMLFRDGKEVVREETTKGKPLKLEEATMNTIGTFGPLLATVLVCATSAGSALRWSRWEKGANGLLVVFRYQAPEQTPHFLVGFGYLANDNGMVYLKEQVPFHGEFAVDPAADCAGRPRTKTAP
jgi:hypothetical protein